MAAPSDCELILARLECTANASQKIIDRIKRERREPTSLEHAELHLAALEQGQRRRDWYSAHLAEGGKPRQFEPPAQAPQGCWLSNKSSTRPTLYIVGVIGEAIQAADVSMVLARIGDDEPLLLDLDTPGGDLDDSMEIYQMILNRRGHTTAIITNAASGGSVVSQAADEILMRRGGWMMIHQVRASTMRDITLADLEIAAKVMREANEKLVAVYQDRWRGSVKELVQAIADETWYDAPAAVESGLADAIASETAIAALGKPRKYGYRNCPNELQLAACASELDQLRLELVAHRTYCV